MRDILQYIIRFLLLVTVQVLILNNIKFLGFINPYLYIAFIITLPLNLSRYYLLLIAFVLGFSIDIFCDTVGMHTFATVFVAFMRDPLFKLFAPRDNYDYSIPSIQTFGMNQFVKYAILMVLLHHIVLFTIEAFSFVNFGILLLRIILNAAFTLFLFLIIERYKMKS
jgi:rod shape-determining protein MreD